MDLGDMRNQIDAIDEQLTALFCQRMDIVHEVAEYKRIQNLPVLHTDRERQVLDRVAALAGDEYADSVRLLFTSLMDLSKAQQSSQLAGESPLSQQLRDLPREPLPAASVIACQGVDGAYSSLAARRMFPDGTLQFHQNFADIFRCVKNQERTFGILPIENSTAGSVNEVYDLMRQYHFYIVRGLKLEVSHCLLAKPGTSLEDITDIYSHEQAIQQCSGFLKSHPHIRVHLYSNTAAAASFVSQQENSCAAAIASRHCADLYGLAVVCDDIKDAALNHTRFIAISDRPLITEDADKVSIALTLPHEPGALYRMITRFAMLGLNLTKLESRPLPNTDFEFLFYFDFAGTVSSEAVLKLLAQSQQRCGYFEFLGNYRET